jgi:hypothetical protein
LASDGRPRGGKRRCVILGGTALRDDAVFWLLSILNPLRGLSKVTAGPLSFKIRDAAVAWANGTLQRPWLSFFFNTPWVYYVGDPDYDRSAAVLFYVHENVQ